MSSHPAITLMRTHGASYDAARERALKVASEATVLLLGELHAGVQPIGCGIAVRTECGSVIVTARHVFDHLREPGRLKIATRSPHAPVSIDYDGLTTIAESGHSRPDPLDLAVLRLLGDSTAKLELHARPIPIAALAAEMSVKPSDVLLGFGYPKDRLALPSPGGTAAACAEPVHFVTYATERVPDKLRRTFGHGPDPIFAPYNRAPPYRSSAEVLVSNPDGMSGSGLWVFGRVRLGGDVELLESPRLAGVVHQHRPKAGLLVATRVESAVSMLWALSPEVRPSLRGTFPTLAASLNAVGEPTVARDDERSAHEPRKAGGADRE